MSKKLGSLPVGALVKDPLTKYYGAPIVWRIADQNHEGYPVNSATLITDKIIKTAGFDANEIDNANGGRKSHGNNRYRTSNLRQWLNSDGAENTWWTAQNLTDGTANTNNHDAKPTTANMHNHNGYDTEAGFLTNFSVKFKAALLTTTLTVAKNTETDGGGSETVEDKIFLACDDEIGFENEDSVAEGSKLAIFNDNKTLRAYPSAEAVANSTNTDESFTLANPWWWWSRTPRISSSCSTNLVNPVGAHGTTDPNDGRGGVRPLCNLSSDILVSDTPDSDGAYVLDFSQIQITLNDMNIDDVVRIMENGVTTPYVIKQKGKPSDMYSDTWNDGVLVVRLHSKEKRAWDADNVNDYEHSDIDTYLNGSFLSELDPDIAAAIMTVKIPYKKGKGNDSSGAIMTGENGLARKVFPLSAYEVGLTKTDSQYIPEDGAKLAGFSDANSRKYTDDAGNAVDWWLRSPRTSDGSHVWRVSADGGYHSGNAYGTGVAVRPAFVLPSNLSVNSDGSVSVNSAPTITSDKSGNLGTLTEGFTCKYSVNDVDTGDSVTVTLTMDSTVINTFTAVKGQQYTYTLTGNDWLKITNGSHTFKITASDGNETTESIATFTRECNKLSTTLSTPLPADDIIKACSLKVVGSIPDDSVCIYEVTNNANDSAPVWEDCTEKVKNGSSHLFTNKTAVNGFAFNFRVSIQRGASSVGGYITQISGGFE